MTGPTVLGQLSTRRVNGAMITRINTYVAHIQTMTRTSSYFSFVLHAKILLKVHWRQPVMVSQIMPLARLFSPMEELHLIILIMEVLISPSPQTPLSLESTAISVHSLSSLE